MLVLVVIGVVVFDDDDNGGVSKSNHKVESLLEGGRRLSNLKPLTAKNSSTRVLQKKKKAQNRSKEPLTYKKNPFYSYTLTATET